MSADLALYVAAGCAFLAVAGIGWVFVGASEDKARRTRLQGAVGAPVQGGRRKMASGLDAAAQKRRQIQEGLKELEESQKAERKKSLTLRARLDQAGLFKTGAMQFWIISGILGVVAAFMVVIAAYILLNRHMLGFQIRLTGQSPRAARFAGVNPNALVLFCLGTSGALAGLAGLFEVAGPAGQISIDFNQGYGFTAIIVAFLGRLHPVGILLAGLLMALTYIGGELAQFMLGIPAAAIQAFQGMLLFFLLGVDVLSNYNIRLGRREVA